MLSGHFGLQILWLGHSFIYVKSRAGASVLTA